MLLYALYIACVAGAVGLCLMLPRGGEGRGLLTVGAVIAAASLGGLWLVVGQMIEGGTELPGSVFAYYYLFSGIAIIASVRVITHTKPVYSALWFVMVVLSSAGMFVLLEAAFMALAMVIIYGGAILVTYVFVIMLASEAGGQHGGQEPPAGSAVYDRFAREPLAASAVGFLLLAVLLTVFVQPMERNETAAVDVAAVAQLLPHRADKRLEDRLGRDMGTDAVPQDLKENAANPNNVELVGIDLFQSHPLGIELAGVILLVALIGAVVIAKRKAQDIKDPEEVTATS